MVPLLSPEITSTSLQTPGVSANTKKAYRHSIQDILKREASNISFVPDTNRTN